MWEIPHKIITIDPIQGLVDYVAEIKPYHTKVVEVLIEYVHADNIDVTIDEQLNFLLHTDAPEELLGVTVTDFLQFSNIGMSFEDGILAYNLENTDSVGFDEGGFGEEADSS